VTERDGLRKLQLLAIMRAGQATLSLLAAIIGRRLS